MLSSESFVTRLASILNVDLGPIGMSLDVSLYEDWALDSLQAFQMIVAIESLADAIVPPVEIPELFTPLDAFEYYMSLVQGG
jgi:acyl carrier protein